MCGRVGSLYGGVLITARFRKHVPTILSRPSWFNHTPVHPHVDVPHVIFLLCMMSCGGVCVVVRLGGYAGLD